MALRETRQLYKALLRSAEPFAYSFREFTKRRVREDFRAPLPKGESAAQRLDFGKDQLVLVQRQSIVSALFSDGAPTAVEVGRAAK